MSGIIAFYAVKLVHINIIRLKPNSPQLMGIGDNNFRNRKKLSE